MHPRVMASLQIVASFAAFFAWWPVFVRLRGDWVVVFAAFGSMSLVDFLFRRIPARCPSCRHLSSYRVRGIRELDYRCRRCAHHVHTGIRSGDD
jgi:hypothetical protein